MSEGLKWITAFLLHQVCTAQTLTGNLLIISHVHISLSVCGMKLIESTELELISVKLWEQKKVSIYSSLQRVTEA